MLKKPSSSALPEGVLVRFARRPGRAGATIACSDENERIRSAHVKPFQTAAAILFAFLLVWGAAGAQTFDADRYLGQCLKLEAGGDLTSARESCRDAPRLEPAHAAAGLALGRLELQLGNIAAAEDALRPVRDRGLPEANLLLAEAALARGDSGAAASFLAGGAPPPGEAGDMTLAARHAWLS